MNWNEDQLEAALDRCEAALESGDPLGALRELRGAPAEHPDVALLESELRIELGELRLARVAWERAQASLPSDDPDLLWLEGQLLLREWRAEEAEQCFLALAVLNESGAGLAALALCRDLAGDEAESDALRARAHALDPETQPLPVRLSREEFDGALKQAFDELPFEIRRSLSDLRTLVEPMPHRSLADFGEPAEIPPDLMGLFCGPTLGELAEATSAPVVYLFQRNIERVCGSLEELHEEIRITLYHEIGHFLGHDEHGLEALGLD